MKKVVNVLINVVTFIVTYEICALVIAYLVGLLFAVISYVPILGPLVTKTRIGETIIYTFMPIAIGMICVAVSGFVHKKFPVDLYTIIVIGVFMSYIVISHLIDTIVYYGLFSWDTANTIWLDAILCLVIFSGLLGLAGLKREN